MAKALITGASGQDAFYLTELLLSKGYEVFGVSRRTSQLKIFPRGMQVIPGDVTDPSLVDIICQLDPEEIYHLAGQSYVWESFKVPQATFEINTFGTINALEGAKLTGSKFYQASTSEMFGNSPAPQNEKTPFYPRSPYGVSKLAAHWLTVNYREAYGMYACCGILFNHESPRRGHDFLSRKVAAGVAKIVKGQTNELKLGNLSAKRDWGHAKDFVQGMWLMLQQDEPRDIVFATGENHAAEDFVRIAFEYVGLDWENHVIFDENLLRPTEVNELRGDPTEALKLGWKPSYTFKQLVEEMVEHELSNG